MKAFLIDPVDQTVTEIDTPADYYEVRELLGVEVASAVYPRKESPRLIMWLDDLGLMHDEVGPLWEMNGVGNVLAGRGVLLGLDDGEGDHVDCPLRPRHGQGGTSPGVRTWCSRAWSPPRTRSSTR